MPDPASDIRTGSKSFALAGLFLPAEKRLAAFRLYAWCRFADDQVDEARDDAEREENLKRLWLRLSSLQADAGDYPWSALHEVTNAYRIPVEYANDLVLGLSQDRPGLRMVTAGDLKRYAYAVAGTVGLMMCHILGVKREDALEEAEALGRAMQLTNIARDVKEDLARDRVYIPREMLDAAGVQGDDILSPENLPLTKKAVDSLLLVAEDLYRKGERGLDALPFRAAFAIACAHLFYREIGRRILRGPPEALLTRSVVPLPVKLVLCARAAWRTLASLPLRLRSRQAPRPYSSLPLWRPEHL